jgi:hypothetical protein
MQMGKLDPNFAAAGLYAGEDLNAMRKAFDAACLQLGELADNERVRQAVALVVTQHYELGLRQRAMLVAAARETGRMVGRDLPKQPLTFFG